MNRFLILVIAFAVGITACKKDNDGPDGPAGGNGTPTFSNVQKNNTLYTTQDGLLLKVDPATGKSTTIFNFGHYNDASGFDYHNGVIYIGDESNTVNAIDVATNKQQWRLPFIADKSSTASEVQVVTKDGIVYAAGDEGIIAAIDPAAKKVLWAATADPAYTPEGSHYFPGLLSVVGDKVIFGSTSTVYYDDADRNYVYVFERATGKRLARLTLPAETAVTGRINLADNTLLIPMGDLVAVDLTSGQEKWRFPMAKLSRGAGTPVITGSKVLVHGATTGSTGGKFLCFDLSSGSKLWEIDGGMDMVGRYTPTVIDGKYVLGFYERGTSRSANGRPFLVSIDSGSKYWENDDLGIDASGTYANGKIYIYGQMLDGDADTGPGLMCIDAATGKVDWVNEEINGLSNSQPLVLGENGIMRGPQFF